MRPRIPLVLVAAGVYAALITVAILALTQNRVPPAPAPEGAPTIDPSLNSAVGDFVTVSGWSDCKMHVKLAATSKADFSVSSGSIIMTMVPGERCQGQATGRITCLVVNGNRAFLSFWLTDSTGNFSVADAMNVTLTENDPQTYGSPVDRAAFGFVSGPDCPPAFTGPGPMIRSGTIHISQARRPSR